MSCRLSCLLVLPCLILAPHAHADEPRRDADGAPLPAGALVRLGRLKAELAGYSALAYSADGKTLASASPGHALELRDAKTGGNLRRLGDRETEVFALAFSPDETLLAAGGTDKEVRLWDPATGKEVRCLSGHTGRINALVFTPDGKALLSASNDNTVRVWDPATGKETLVFRGHKDTIRGLVISADGKTAVSADESGYVRLWDVASGEPKVRTPGECGSLYSVALSPDGKTIAAGGWDNSLRLYDAGTGKELHRCVGHLFSIHGIAFSTDGKVIASASYDGKLFFWDAATGAERRQSQQPGRINALARSADGRTLAAAGSEGIYCWEIATAKSVPLMQDPRGPVLRVGFTGNATVWTTDEGRVVRYWKAADGKLQSMHPAPEGTSEARLEAATADGRMVLPGESGQFILWDPVTDKVVRSFTLPEVIPTKGGPPVGLAVSADGDTLAIATATGVVHTWQVPTGRLLPPMTLPTGAMASVALSPDGKTGATYQPETGAVLVWETATGKLRAGVNLGRDLSAASRNGRSSATTLTFTAGGLALAAWVRDAEVRVWAPGSKLDPMWSPRESDDRAARTVAFSSDGRLIAAGVGNHVIVWSSVRGKELARFSGHREAVTCLAFSPDNRSLASGSADTTVLIWSLAEVSKKAADLPTHVDPDATAEELDNLWQDLESEDGERAYRALRRLSALPDQCVPLLRERVKVTGPTAAQIERLVADLDGDRFAVRQRATRELDEMGVTAEPVLRKALEGKPSLEVRQRIELLVGRMKGRPLTGELLRGWRALEILERVGNPEARKALEKFAEGPAAALIAEEAKASLGRLEHRRLAAETSANSH